MAVGTGRSGFVGIFDSGLGGLSVWREVRSQLPRVNTLYVADQAHVPYGSHRPSEVQEFSRGITRFMLDMGANVIVVACNTASAAALHHLRRTFPAVPFVGMEPAVKPATERTRAGVVGVIATPTTFQGELFASLMDRYAGDVQVRTQICPGLVDAVEAGALHTLETEALLRECLTPLIDAGIDQLVLGCTHYPFLRSTIERIVGGDVAIIDPAPAVARQVGRVLRERGAAVSPPAQEQSPSGSRDTDPPDETCHLFLTSGDVEWFAEMRRRLVPSSARDTTVRAARWLGGRLEPVGQER
jgi:glutamate racemase